MTNYLTVYLAGYMNANCIDKCIFWRNLIKSHYSNWKGAGLPYPIVFLDPLNGPHKDSIDQYSNAVSNVPSSMIVEGDRMSVKSSDVIIANLDTFGESRDIIGTFFEMAWAFDWQKPILSIIPEGSEFLYHPFIGESSTLIVNDIQEIIDKKYLNFFFKRINNAMY